MVMEEVRIKNWITDTVINKQEVYKYPEWARYGWDKKSPMYHFVFLCVIEFKIKGIASVFQLKVPIVFLFDKGSVPDIIPDAIADDHGWFWQQVAYYIHDVGYTVNYYNRAFWDNVLRAILVLAKMNTTKIWLVYTPVKLFGGFVYNKPMNIIKHARENILVTEVDEFSLMLHDTTQVRRLVA